MPLNSPQKVLFYRMFPALLKADEAYMGLDALGNGILFGIINHQCLNGSVPADPMALAGIVRAKPEEVREFLASFTKLKTLEALEGGPSDRLANPYLHRELKAIHAIIEARRQAGAKGGQKTQANARPAEARTRLASSNVQAELEAPVEFSSSRQEQESENTQIKKGNSRQRRIHSGRSGAARAVAGAADGRVSLSDDIQEGLGRLGISSQLGAELCDKAGGPRGLRVALELLDTKVQQNGIHSPSGFFLRCVEDLAQEGQAQFDQAHEEAMKSHRKALRDTRWIQLPESCRESLEVLRAWCAWWNLREQVSSATASRKSGLAAKAGEARNAFMEICLRHHPQRTEFLTAIAEKQEALGKKSESPGIANRVRIAVLGNLLGLNEMASDGPKPTPADGVAS